MGEVLGLCEHPVPTPGSRSPLWSACQGRGQPDSPCWSCSPGWGMRVLLCCWRGRSVGPGGCRKGQEEKKAQQVRRQGEKRKREGSEDSPKWAGKGSDVLSPCEPLFSMQDHSDSDPWSSAGPRAQEHSQDGGPRHRVLLLGVRLTGTRHTCSSPEKGPCSSRENFTLERSSAK